MRKKLLCLLLAGCMLFSTAMPALADNTDQTIESESSEADDVDTEDDASVTVTPEATVTAAPTETPGETEDSPETTEPSETSVIPEATNTYALLRNSSVEDTPVIYYSGHVQDIGWQSSVNTSQTSAYAGTTGRSLRMEALKIDTKDLVDLEYSGHVQDIGWQSFVKADGTNIAGTTGRSLRLEAIKIRLTGESAELYDIYYRVHSAEVGWLGWAKNGEAAGTAKYCYAMQAIQIMILPKDSEDAPATGTAYIEKFSVYQQAHVSEIGWMTKTEVANGIVGTTGRSLNLEAFKLTTTGAYGIGIKYRAHVANVGWQSFVSNGTVAGTTGQKNPIEAVEIELTGENADMYDIYYRAHVAEIGWLDWAKNGESAGSSGCSTPIQAIQIVVVTAGQSAPGSTNLPYFEKATVNYQTSTAQNGWATTVKNGAVSGTTGQSLVVESFSANISGVDGLSIQYNAHVSNVGWQGYVDAGSSVGKSGEQIEAIQMKLTGSLSKYYNVWYRVYNSKHGWLDWAKNGESAGTSKLSTGIEAVQVVVLLKSKVAPGKTDCPYKEYTVGWVYINGYRRYRDESGNLLNDVSHLFNPSQKRMTVDCYSGVTTVYGYNSATGSYDTPIRAFYCSVGRAGHNTPSGTYRIYNKYESKVMNASDGSYHVWAPYISCFNGAIYFHGVASINTTPNQIAQNSWYALGSPASSGCVRLAGIEAKWVYYNCPIGTPVIVGSYSSPMACPMTPTRYPWTGGNVAGDPTL